MADKREVVFTDVTDVDVVALCVDHHDLAQSIDDFGLVAMPDVEAFNRFSPQLHSVIDFIHG